MSRRRMAADIAALQRLAAQHRAEVDRLRAAADLCDAWAADTKAANSALLTSWKIDAATADLLRAVVEANPCWCQGKIGGYQYVDPVCAWHVVADPVVAAALALADTILGLDDGSSHE